MKGRSLQSAMTLKRSYASRRTWISIFLQKKKLRLAWRMASTTQSSRFQAIFLRTQRRSWIKIQSKWSLIMRRVQVTVSSPVSCQNQALRKSANKFQSKSRRHMPRRFLLRWRKLARGWTRLRMPTSDWLMGQPKSSQVLINWRVGCRRYLQVRCNLTAVPKRWRKACHNMLTVLHKPTQVANK